MAKLKPRSASPIHSDLSAKSALRQLAASAAQEFAAQLERTMTSDDIEGPHKARVALRKLRATLRAFRPILRKRFYRRHLRELRWLARTIGHLRDADVLARSFGHPKLVTAAARLRRKTRRRLAHAKADRWALRLTRALQGSDWHRSGKSARTARRAALSPLARAALGEVWRTCLRHGPDLTSLPADHRHELRKSLKSLRYLCDQFAPLWSGGTDFLNLLAGLQDDLGHLNDVAVARAHGLTMTAEPQTLAHAQMLWSRLQAAPAFWDASG